LADENYNVATYLLEKGALFNIPDEDGNTAIHLLCLKNKAEILNSTETLTAKLIDDTIYKKELHDIDAKCTVLENNIKTLIAAYARAQMEQNEYNTKYNESVAEYDKMQKRRQELNSAIALCSARKKQIKAFLGELEKQNKLLIEFDETIWYSMLNVMKVISETEVIFIFRDGSEVPWNIDCEVRSNGNKKKNY
jgi:ankyrin repeat protein